MAKTTLTLQVNYDPEVTDPESLASALDTLMETVTSTPGILEEYGDPEVGPFYPLDARVENFAPDMDVFHITVGDVRVVVERNEDGQVEVTVSDLEKGGGHTYFVLGQEGETQKV